MACCSIPEFMIPLKSCAKPFPLLCLLVIDMASMSCTLCKHIGCKVCTLCTSVCCQFWKWLQSSSFEKQLYGTRVRYSNGSYSCQPPMSNKFPWDTCWELPIYLGGLIPPSCSLPWTLVEGSCKYCVVMACHSIMVL